MERPREARAAPGSELRRALIATMLGITLGAVIASFSRREARD